MRKRTLSIFIALAVLTTSGCGVVKVDEQTEDTLQAATATQETINSELAEKYDFYQETIEKIIEEMEVTQEQADKIFSILIECGMDKKVSYIFDEDKYYKVWWGLTKTEVYLKDGEVEKVLDGDVQLYPSHNESDNQTEEIKEIQVLYNEDKKLNIINLDIDGTKTKQGIVADYWIQSQKCMGEIDKTNLKDEYKTQIMGNVTRNGKIECTIKAEYDTGFLKSNEDLTAIDLQDNTISLFIPKPLQ